MFFFSPACAHFYCWLAGWLTDWLVMPVLIGLEAEVSEKSIDLHTRIPLFGACYYYCCCCCCCSVLFQLNEYFLFNVWLLKFLNRFVFFLCFFYFCCCWECLFIQYFFHSLAWVGSIVVVLLATCWFPALFSNELQSSRGSKS